MAIQVSPSIKDFFAKISDYHKPETLEKTVGLKQVMADRAPLGAGQGDQPVAAQGTNDLAKAASWIFGMLKDCGAAIYKFVSEQGNNEDQAKLDQDKAEIEKFRADMTALGKAHPELHDSLTAIIDEHVKHLEEKATRTRTITLLSGSGIACAAAGVIAGLFVIKWLLTAAIVIGLGIAALSIYNYVKNPEKPGEIKNLLESFQFKDQMV